MSKNWSDGTPREIRPAQQQALDEIELAFQTSQVVAESAPPGYGKSFIARARQRSGRNVDLATSDNSLLRQFCDTYPVLNAVMGKDWYKTEDDYQQAQRAAQHSPSIFNPLSHYYARQRGLREPEELIVDEAHLTVDMLTYMSATVVPISRTKAPRNPKNEGELIKWCYERHDLLRKAVSQGGDIPGAVYREFESISRLRDNLLEGTQKQVFDISKQMLKLGAGRPQECLVLTPVRVPSGLIKTVTAAKRLLVMSGTMTRYDAEQLAAGRSLVYHQRPYLTPKVNRPVYYDPVATEDRKNPEALANKVRSIYLANPGPTVVHVSYAQQGILEHLLNDLKPLVNTTRNKAEVKRQFISNGGLWLAAGLSEGLDLPYETCTQVIIPTLLYPDRSALFIQKRAGLADGDYWYALRTIQNTVQRLGRGLRAADDECVCHILDPSFPRTYDKVKHEFTDLNMIWGKI